MNVIEKFVDYLRSSKHELTKVTWPSKESTTRYSILVITVSLAVAAFFGILDMGLTELVNKTLVERAVQNAPAQGQPDQPVVPTTVPTDGSEAPAEEAPEFDFNDIQIETDGQDADIDVETVPIEESTDNQ